MIYGRIAMMGGMSLWLGMWTRPKSTIRSILHTNPRCGVFYLAAIYALQSLFYFSNYWSLGFSFPTYAIVIGSLVFSPLLGLIWVYFAGWILSFTGKWLEGRAPMVYLRTVAAWSKVPTAINLLMWLILLTLYPDYVFVLDAGGPSSFFISFITLVLSIWSLVLLIQSIREVQGFSVGRAVINVLLAGAVSTLLSFLLFAFIRYLYLLTL